MAINSWFSWNLFLFFFAVFNGKIPKRSLGETFVVSSSNSTKRKKQKKTKSCPAGATSQGQNCAVLEQSWLLPAANLGKEMKQLKRNLKNSLFFVVFLVYFLKVKQPQIWKIENYQMKITLRGGSVCQDVDPGVVAAFAALQGGEGWDFSPGFLFPSLGGEKIPPLLASFFS